MWLGWALSSRGGYGGLGWVEYHSQLFGGDTWEHSIRRVRGTRLPPGVTDVHAISKGVPGALDKIGVRAWPVGGTGTKRPSAQEAGPLPGTHSVAPSNAGIMGGYLPAARGGR